MSLTHIPAAFPTHSPCSVATIAIAYDNAPYERKPVDWQLPKVWIISTVMGLLLAAGTWIIRGTLFLHDGGIIQNFGRYAIPTPTPFECF